MKTLEFGKDRKLALTSDTHHSHRQIIAYCKRPWLWLDTDNYGREADGLPFEVSDAAFHAHNQALIDNINSVVGENDVLIHLGDVSWGERTNLVNFRNALHVNEIYVCVGNHDDEDDLKAVFGADKVAERWKVVKDGPGGARTAICDHYPGHSWDGSHKGVWHAYGHVHNNLRTRHLTNPGWLLSFDAGVDAHDFKPWLWEEEIKPMLDRRQADWKVWRDSVYGTPKEMGGMAKQKPL